MRALLGTWPRGLGLKGQSHETEMVLKGQTHETETLFNGQSHESGTVVKGTVS